ncbi:MAG: holin [Clostridia bacterium]|nr:holin [Clostridia bacterium]
MNNIDYTELIQAIIALVSVLITTFLIPFLKKKLSAERLEELKKWVSIAVKAAEQLYGSKTGQQKKEYVVAFLLSKGIVFDVDEVNTLIESEVYKLTQG